MTEGPYAWVFWGPQIFLGVAVPLLILFARPGGTSLRKIEEIGLAGLLILIGIFAVRINIVIPALAVPLLPGVDTEQLRMTALYVPNWVEWLSSLGMVAVGLLVFRFVLHRLPLREHQDWPQLGPARPGAGRIQTSNVVSSADAPSAGTSSAS
jgi:molybdopterin-containing oxidoreductase family membrane subunit